MICNLRDTVDEMDTSSQFLPSKSHPDILFLCSQTQMKHGGPDCRKTARDDVGCFVLSPASNGRPELARSQPKICFWVRKDARDAWFLDSLQRYPKTAKTNTMVDAWVQFLWGTTWLSVLSAPYDPSPVAT